MHTANTCAEGPKGDDQEADPFCRTDDLEGKIARYFEHGVCDQEHHQCHHVGMIAQAQCLQDIVAGIRIQYLGIAWSSSTERRTFWTASLTNVGTIQIAEKVYQNRQWDEPDINLADKSIAHERQDT